MARTREFFSSILAGMMISIGGLVYLIVGSVGGALFFGTGLFGILFLGLNLYTGRIGYLLEKNASYLIDLLLSWLGNLIGCFATAWLFSQTRLAANPAVMDNVKKICATKLNDSPLSMMILAVFCGLLVFIAVEAFKTSPNHVVQIAFVFLPIAVFILCGFEHVVADMFYFSMAGMWSVKTLLWILAVTLGNSIGALILPLYRKCFGIKKI